MRKVLLPLPFERSNEVITLLKEIIEANKDLYKKEIEDLKLEKELIEYMIVGALNDKYCYPGVDEKLPEWLRTFLFECYLVAHNHIASKQ